MQLEISMNINIRQNYFHLDIAKIVNQRNKARNLINLIDLQSSIISGATAKGSKLSSEEINEQLLQNKEFFEKNDIMRILYLIRYYNPDNDITDLTERLGNSVSITESDLKLIEYFTVERSLIDEEYMKRINKEIILFRNRNKYNTREEKENKSDKRYICVKESKLTTLCDMCCKNELPEGDFEYVLKPKLLNNINHNKKQFTGDFLIDNKDLDSQSEMAPNDDNLIIFNVGASLEKANKNKQFGMNIIYGSNQIYNHREYIEYIKEYFKGKSGIVGGNDYRKIKNDDKEDVIINFPQDSSQDQLKEQKINLFNNSNANNDIRNSRDTMSYDQGPMSNSGIKNSYVSKPKNNNIRNTMDSDDFYTSDYK